MSLDTNLSLYMYLWTICPYKNVLGKTYWPSTGCTNHRYPKSISNIFAQYKLFSPLCGLIQLIWLRPHCLLKRLCHKFDWCSICNIISWPYLFIFEHSSLGATTSANGQCLLWEFTNLALDMIASFAQVKQL